MVILNWACNQDVEEDNLHNDRGKNEQYARTVGFLKISDIFIKT